MDPFLHFQGENRELGAGRAVCSGRRSLGVPQVIFVRCLKYVKFPTGSYFELNPKLLYAWSFNFFNIGTQRPQSHMHELQHAVLA